jgi:hypothetical protein
VRLPHLLLRRYAPLSCISTREPARHLAPPPETGAKVPTQRGLSGARRAPPDPGARAEGAGALPLRTLRAPDAARSTEAAAVARGVIAARHPAPTAAPRTPLPTERVQRRCREAPTPPSGLVQHVARDARPPTARARGGNLGSGRGIASDNRSRASLWRLPARFPRLNDTQLHRSARAAPPSFFSSGPAAAAHAPDPAPR